MVKQLKSLASEYAKTANGAWLNEFDCQNVPEALYDSDFSDQTPDWVGFDSCKTKQ